MDMFNFFLLKQIFRMILSYKKSKLTTSTSLVLKSLIHFSHVDIIGSLMIHSYVDINGVVQKSIIIFYDPSQSALVQINFLIKIIVPIK